MSFVLKAVQCIGLEFIKIDEQAGLPFSLRLSGLWTAAFFPQERSAKKSAAFASLTAITYYGKNKKHRITTGRI
jgi:hypothetical protein